MSDFIPETPDTGEIPETEEATGVTTDSDVEDTGEIPETEQPKKLWAGKFETPEDMEKAFMQKHMEKNQKAQIATQPVSDKRVEELYYDIAEDMILDYQIRNSYILDKDDPNDKKMLSSISDLAKKRAQKQYQEELKQDPTYTTLQMIANDVGLDLNDPAEFKAAQKFMRKIQSSAPTPPVKQPEKTPLPIYDRTQASKGGGSIKGTIETNYGLPKELVSYWRSSGAKESTIRQIALKHGGKA